MTEPFRAEAALAPLKAFQRRTVDYVFDRLYGTSDPVRQFLVADEVGLGKTMVARGVIARTIERLWDRARAHRRPLHLLQPGDRRAEPEPPERSEPSRAGTSDANDARSPSTSWRRRPRQQQGEFRQPDAGNDLRPALDDRSDDGACLLASPSVRSRGGSPRASQPAAGHGWSGRLEPRRGRPLAGRGGHAHRGTLPRRGAGGPDAIR